MPVRTFKEGAFASMKRILIADDQISSREALSKHASLRGYLVVAVNDGIDLVAAANSEEFDLIITDLIMPDLNGVSAAEIMKLQGNKTPVIALTGLSPNDLGLADTCFTRVYHKPVNLDALFRDIGELLDTGSVPAP
jgi:CheY-like chemotaxis protein